VVDFTVDPHGNVKDCRKQPETPPWQPPQPPPSNPFLRNPTANDFMFMTLLGVAMLLFSFGYWLVTGEVLSSGVSPRNPVNGRPILPPPPIPPPPSITSGQPPAPKPPVILPRLHPERPATTRIPVFDTADPPPASRLSAPPASNAGDGGRDETTPPDVDEPKNP